MLSKSEAEKNSKVNPVMITLARETRGLTQRELADILNVTQGKVSKMESGFLQVSEAILESLSVELRYPKKFFYQNFEVYPAGMHLYRKHKTLPNKDLTRIAASMNVFRTHVKQLLQSAEIDYKPLLECDLDEYGTPSEIARIVRQHLQIPRGVIKSVTEILEDAGVLIIPFNPQTRFFSGASMLTEKPNYIVVINETMPGDRWRWTLAHELGHMVMHRIPTEDMEREADEFAAEFLMPAREIGQFLSNLTVERLAFLKRQWKVSMIAILNHALRLNKITPRQHRSLITRLAQLGITRIKEPAELNFPVEQPTLLNELIEFHGKELGFDVTQMADIFCSDVTEYIDTYKPTTSHLRLVSGIK